MLLSGFFDVVAINVIDDVDVVYETCNIN